MRRSPVVVAAATVTAAIACFTATPAQALAPTASTRHRPQTSHGFGLDVNAARSHKVTMAHGQSLRTTGSPRDLRTRIAATPPSSYSLKQYALAPGNQGPVGSCVAWATGYTAYGILMHEQGISGSPMAPMFIYSQIAQGRDTGTTASAALPMEYQQGIDRGSDYWQGSYDYTTQPTQEERDKATYYELSGYTDLTASGNVKSAIKSAISSGKPVVVGFLVRTGLFDLDSANHNYSTASGPYAKDSNGNSEGHEVTIVGYTSTGVTIENSWGTNWGDKGYFTAPWSWITSSDILEIHSMGKILTS